MSLYTYGKLPAKPQSAPKFSDVFGEVTSLPPLPQGDFGHEENIVWPDFGNDQFGDCVWGGEGSEELLWATETGRKINVNKASALANYSQCTGFNQNPTPAQIGPNGENLTDKGTDMGQAANYRMNPGAVDADGNRHPISGWIQLEPGNIQQFWYAVYLFDGVGIGWSFPQEWEDALQYGYRVLDTVANPNIAGGHYTPGMGRRNGNISTPSWQMLLQVTPAGYQQFNDETFAYMTKDKVLPDGKTLTGLDYAQWRAEFALVHGMSMQQAQDIPQAA